MALLASHLTFLVTHFTTCTSFSFALLKSQIFIIITNLISLYSLTPSTVNLLLHPIISSKTETFINSCCTCCPIFLSFNTIFQSYSDHNRIAAYSNVQPQPKLTSLFPRSIVILFHLLPHHQCRSLHISLKTFFFKHTIVTFLYK